MHDDQIRGLLRTLEDDRTPDPDFADALYRRLHMVAGARQPSRAPFVLLAAALPTAVTVAFEWFGLASPSNLTRALCSIPLGATAAWLFIRALRAEAPPRQVPQMRYHS